MAEAGIVRAFREALDGGARLAVLTGAGVSAESGVSTFRDPEGGLWARYDPQELASPAAYARDPALVWRWYAWRYAACVRAEPNAAHLRLAALERRYEGAVTLVTQNVDGLHGRAGSRPLELHGNLTRARCERCGMVAPLLPPEAFRPPPLCPRCAAPMRPDVVWFGESLPGGVLAQARSAFSEAGLALVIGTSGVVQPAAGLAGEARRAGALLVEINPEPTPLSADADLSLRLGASAGLARLLDSGPDSGAAG